MRLPAGPPPLDLLSPLPRAECCRLLEAAMDQRDLFGRGSKPVVGTVTAQAVTARKRIAYRNSFQYLLTATLADDGGGTRIRGRFAMQPFVTGFVIFWVGIVACGALVIVPAELRPLLSGNAPTDGWVVLIPVWMLLGMAALLFLGRTIGLSESRFLTDFVRRTVQAP